MNYSPQIYWRKVRNLIEQKKVIVDHVILMLDPTDPFEERYVYKYNLDEPMKRKGFKRPDSRYIE